MQVILGIVILVLIGYIVHLRNEIDRYRAGLNGIYDQYLLFKRNGGYNWRLCDRELFWQFQSEVVGIVCRTMGNFDNGRTFQRATDCQDFGE